MRHQFTFEDVVQNVDKVKETVRRVLTEIATAPMSEGVSKWLPPCPRQRVFFFHLFFGQAIFPDLDVESVPDCVFQCVDILDYYYE
jgi:hypothetical protein